MSDYPLENLSPERFQQFQQNHPQFTERVQQFRQNHPEFQDRRENSFGDKAVERPFLDGVGGPALSGAGGALDGIGYRRADPVFRQANGRIARGAFKNFENGWIRAGTVRRIVSAVALSGVSDFRACNAAEPGTVEGPAFQKRTGFVR